MIKYTTTSMPSRLAYTEVAVFMAGRAVAMVAAVLVAAILQLRLNETELRMRLRPKQQSGLLYIFLLG